MAHVKNSQPWSVHGQLSNLVAHPDGQQTQQLRMVPLKRVLAPPPAGTEWGLQHKGSASPSPCQQEVTLAPAPQAWKMASCLGAKIEGDTKHYCRKTQTSCLWGRSPRLPSLHPHWPGSHLLFHLLLPPVSLRPQSFCRAGMVASIAVALLGGHLACHSPASSPRVKIGSIEAPGGYCCAFPFSLWVPTKGELDGCGKGPSKSRLTSELSSLDPL